MTTGHELAPSHARRGPPTSHPRRSCGSRQSQIPPRSRQLNEWRDNHDGVFLSPQSPLSLFLLPNTDNWGWGLMRPRIPPSPPFPSELGVTTAGGLARREREGKYNVSAAASPSGFFGVPRASVVSTKHDRSTGRSGISVQYQGGRAVGVLPPARLGRESEKIPLVARAALPCSLSLDLPLRLELYVPPTPLSLFPSPLGPLTPSPSFPRGEGNLAREKKKGKKLRGDPGSLQIRGCWYCPGEPGWCLRLVGYHVPSLSSNLAACLPEIELFFPRAAHTPSLSGACRSPGRFGSLSFRQICLLGARSRTECWKCGIALSRRLSCNRSQGCYDVGMMPMSCTRVFDTIQSSFHVQWLLHTRHETGLHV